MLLMRLIGVMRAARRILRTTDLAPEKIRLQMDERPAVGGYGCAVRNFVGRLRAWSTAHPWVADAGLAAVTLALAEVSSRASIDVVEWGDPSFRTPSFLEEQVGLVATIAPLALRRRAPLVALLACTTGFVGSRILLHAAEPSVVGIAMSIAVYSAAAYGRTPWRHVACAACAAAIMGELWREVNENVPPGQPSVVLFNAFFLLFYTTLIAAMWALGNAIGAGRRRAAELLERTRALERQREENARRAVFDERVRIARELHDVVAHHVSLMGVQAGAARMVMGRDPAKSEAALSSIEASSRQAVEELHRLLGFLRQAGDPDDLAPRPGVGQVPGLAAGMSNPHLTVAVDVEGEARPLPPTVDVSAYRIIQEALTNTLKHAGASRADVRLRYWPGELEVEVVDDGGGPVDGSRGPGGLGLIGMRERAALLGGQLKAGPGRDGGFSVRAKLPTAERAL